MRKPPVLLLGVGEGHGPYHLHEMPELPSPATRISGEAAFAMAGVRPRDIDVAEVFDAFTIAALIAMEQLGFCEAGQGGRYSPPARRAWRLDSYEYDRRHADLGQRTYPRRARAVRQVRGEAGASIRFANVELALAHGIGGPMAHSCTTCFGEMRLHMADGTKPLPSPTDATQPFWSGCGSACCDCGVALTVTASEDWPVVCECGQSDFIGPTHPAAVVYFRIRWCIAHLIRPFAPNSPISLQ